MARLTVTAGSGRTARVPSPPTSSSQPPGTTFNLLPGSQPPLITPSWSPLTTPTPIPTTHQPSGLCCGLLPCLVSLCGQDLAWGSRPDGRAVLEKWHVSQGLLGVFAESSPTRPDTHCTRPPTALSACQGTGLRSARPLAGWPRSAAAHAHSLSPAHAPSPLGHPLFSDSASVTVEAP